MVYIIELFIYSLFVLNDNHFVRAFNESCGVDKPPCLEPLKCISGYCVCSAMGKTTDANNPLAYWTGEQCIKCPLDYTTIKLILGKEKQMNWIRARKQCQDTGGDLLIFRSEKEYTFITYIVQTSINTTMMYQRVPQNGSSFASVWLGAKLADWKGEGKYNLVSYGPPLTKTSHYWCSHSSPLGQEPNYIGLKTTGERQECVGLAVFPNKFICMHDWFCDWDSYVLCEIPVPSSNGTDLPAALEETPDDNTRVYMIIGGGVLLCIVSIGVLCCLCRKKKTISRTRSVESAETGTSEN